MRALVTGVGGFTGRYLARVLAGAGYEVFGVAQVPVSVPSVAKVFAADLNDQAALFDVVANIRPQAVAHLAAISFVAHGDTDEIYRTNLLGTRNLLEALTRASCDCNSVLLASSANIYGNASEMMLTEDTPPAPANDYAVSKLAMEYLARLYSERLPIVIARPFNYTGVGQSESFLLPKIVNHVRRREETMDLGYLGIARDFSDVRTVVGYYRLLMECPVARGGTFNVCSGRAYSLREIIKMVQNISGHGIEVRVNPAFVRQNDVKVLLGSCDRLIATVGRIEDIPLEETLRWMLESTA